MYVCSLNIQTLGTLELFPKEIKTYLHHLKYAGNEIQLTVYTILCYSST